VVEASYQNLTQLGPKIIDFRKLNAELKEIDGQRVYEYTFVAAIEFPSGCCAWKRIPGSIDVEVVRDTGKKFDVVNTFESIPKGTIGVRKGLIRFRYTERGWLSAELPAYFADGYCPPLKPEACYQLREFNKLN